MSQPQSIAEIAAQLDAIKAQLCELTTAAIKNGSDHSPELSQVTTLVTTAATNFRKVEAKVVAEDAQQPSQQKFISHPGQTWVCSGHWSCCPDQEEHERIASSETSGDVKHNPGVLQGWGGEGTSSQQ